MKTIKLVKYNFPGSTLKTLIELSANSKMVKKPKYRTFICKCLKISPQRLSLYENGKAMPNIDQLIWFMHNFNADFDTFIK